MVPAKMPKKSPALTGIIEYAESSSLSLGRRVTKKDLFLQAPLLLRSLKRLDNVWDDMARIVVVLLKFAFSSFEDHSLCPSFQADSVTASLSATLFTSEAKYIAIS
jgi:hypothetical protein